MSEFSFSEFLDENASRDYPLQEGSSLPPGFLLDARILSRGKRVSQPRVSRVVGAGESQSGLLGVEFSTGCLSQDGESEDALLVEVHPGGPSQVFGSSQFGQSVWSSVAATFGEGAGEAFSEDDFVPDSALLEPTLLTMAHASSVHSLEIQGHGPVSGAVVLSQGRNVRTESGARSVLVGCSRGAGEKALSAEEFVDVHGGGDFGHEVLDPCGGTVRFVNGISPDPSGAFSISGGRGISVRPFPESHMVALVVSVPSTSKVCFEAPEPGSGYLWMLDEEGNLVPTSELPENLEPGQAWLLDPFGRLIPAESILSDPYWSEVSGGISPS